MFAIGGLGALALIAALVGSLALYLAVTWGVFDKVPPIAQNLGGEAQQTTEQLSAEFDQRVDARYPPGTSAQAMADDLLAQGFVSERGVLVWKSRMVCSHDLIVQWRTDGAGRLEDTTGLAGPKTCF